MRTDIEARNIIEPPERERLIPLNEVMRLVGLGRTTIYKMIGERSFPPPVKLGQRASRWIEREVCDWQLAQISLRDRAVGKN